MKHGDAGADLAGVFCHQVRLVTKGAPGNACFVTKVARIEHLRRVT